VRVGHCAYAVIVVDVPVFLRNNCIGFVGQELKVVMRNEWGFMCASKRGALRGSAGQVIYQVG